MRKLIKTLVPLALALTLALPVQTAFAGTVAASKTAQSAAVQTNTSSFSFTVKDFSKLPKDKYQDEFSKPIYDNAIKNAKEMKRLLSTYITKAKFTKVKPDDLKKVLKNEYITISSPEIGVYDKQYYAISNFTTLDIGYAKSTFTTTVQSSEGMGGSDGKVMEIRKYTPVKGVTPYAVLLNQNTMVEEKGQYVKKVAPGYFIIFVDGKGKLVESIGLTSYGQGYYKY